MPIKKDGTGKRWVEMELMVPGTPEAVWHALATGPGNAAWFVKAEIEPRVGGALRFDFGEGVTSAGEVTQWDPPRQFGYVEREWEAGAPPITTEITITSRSGDRCVVRMVHSLFTSSDAWDDQVEGFEAGWPGFFAVLRAYLGHFSDLPAASFVAFTKPNLALGVAWTRLCELLGIVGVNAGERPTRSVGPEAAAGIVEHIHQDATQRYLVLRLDEPSPGAMLVGCYERAGTVQLSVCRYCYGSDAESVASTIEPQWRGFLTESFRGPFEK